MSSHHGHFTWCELMTTDAAAASDFYRTAIGWSIADAGMPDRRYLVLTAGDTPIGGMMDLPSVGAAGARPGWIGYIGVEDVDAMVARATGAGGHVHRPATDIPGVGRFAVVADPQGAAFTLFAPSGMEPPPPSTAPEAAPGRIGWYELQAGDWQSAFAFYAGLFGWTKTDAVEMGPMGTYQMFATGGATIGGMMTKADAMPMPAWVFYFNVDGIDAAVSRVKEAGGQVLNGPMEVPGGSWIAQALDPQGAMFAMVGPKH